MIGEVSLGGVLVPSLLLLAGGAMVLTFLLTRVLAVTGLYRFAAARPALDLALFVVILALLVLATAPAEVPG